MVIPQSTAQSLLLSYTLGLLLHPSSFNPLSSIHPSIIPLSLLHLCHSLYSSPSSSISIISSSVVDFSVHLSPFPYSFSSIILYCSLTFILPFLCPFFIHLFPPHSFLLPGHFLLSSSTLAIPLPPLLLLYSHPSSIVQSLHPIFFPH